MQGTYHAVYSFVRKLQHIQGLQGMKRDYSLQLIEGINI